MNSDWATIAQHAKNNTLTKELIISLMSPPTPPTPCSLQTLTQKFNIDTLQTSLKYQMSDLQHIGMAITYTRYYNLLPKRAKIIAKVFQNNKGVDILISELLMHNIQQDLSPTKRQLNELLRSMNPTKNTQTDLNITTIATLAAEALNIGFWEAYNQTICSTIKATYTVDMASLTAELQFKKMGIYQPQKWLHFIRNKSLVEQCLTESIKILKKRNKVLTQIEFQPVLQSTLTPRTSAFKRTELTSIITDNFSIPGYDSLPNQYTSLPVVRHTILPLSPTQLSQSNNCRINNLNTRTRIFKDHSSGNLNPDLYNLLQL